MKTDPISAAVVYRNALEEISRAASLAAAVRIAQRMLTFTFTRPEEGTVNIESGYGHNTRTPFVMFALANPTESANPFVQVDTKQARALAYQILEAADAAESDGFLVEWLRRSDDIDDRAMGNLLADFRAYRETLRGKA
jgi:hypothetical protein